MPRISLISAQFLLGSALAVGTTFAQSSFTERMATHNSSMSALQPSFITPIVAADPRLLQYVRASFSRGFTATGTETVSYGNNRGGGVIAGNRLEFDFMPPAYIQHNSSAADGFGDTGTLVKFRIASGNAEHGNFDLALMASHTFATGSHTNGARTDTYCPTLAAGYAFGRRFDLLSSVGGTLPTGKIATQGRAVSWNSVAQAHATKHIWFEVENNSAFYLGGEHDGQIQNFLLPGAFYVIRKKDWKPTHPFFIVDSGMQIATSGFHTSNHNLISEMRMLF